MGAPKDRQADIKKFPDMVIVQSILKYVQVNYGVLKTLDEVL